MEEGFAEKFIRGYNIGLQQKREKMLDAQAAEDRKLAQEIHRLHINRLKLEDKLQTRQEALQNFQLQESQPGQLPAEVPLPNNALPANAAYANETLGTNIQKTPSPPIESYAQNAPMTIPGVTGPDVTLTPSTPYQRLIQARLARGLENAVDVPGMGTMDVRALPAMLENLRQRGTEQRQQETITHQESQLSRRLTSEEKRAAEANLNRLKAAGIRAVTKPGAEQDDFRQWASQLNTLYGRRASIEKGVDPFTQTIIPQANIDTALATTNQEIARTENYLRANFPDQFRQFTGEGEPEPAPPRAPAIVKPPETAQPQRKYTVEELKVRGYRKVPGGWQKRK